MPWLDRLTAASALALGAAAWVGTPTEPAPGRRAEAATLRAPTPTAAPPSAPVVDAPAIEEACPRLQVDLPELPSFRELDRPVPPIEDDGGTMAPFYEKLARLLRGKRRDHLRIGFYADSNGTQDYMTGAMRRWLQARYGDAGHGYVALAKPWDWYAHKDVRHGIDRVHWGSHAVSSNWFSDGYYGFGLVAGETRVTNVSAWVETAARDAAVGRTVTSIEVMYLKRPGGGSFEVLVDGAPREVVRTDAPAIAPGYLRVALPDAPHRLECRTREAFRPVRLLGAILERDVGKPSVVLDTLSVGGASWRTMLREDFGFDKETLRHRGYDLLMVQMGTNTWGREKGRADTMREVLARFQAAIPEAPLLVLTIPDHHDDGELIALEVVPEARKVLRQAKVALFDFHAAMGGLGSMKRFWTLRMSQGDIIHFNAKGGAYMGMRVLHALYRGLAEYVAARPRAGCGEGYGEPVPRHTPPDVSH